MTVRQQGNHYLCDSCDNIVCYEKGLPEGWFGVDVGCYGGKWKDPYHYSDRTLHYCGDKCLRLSSVNLSSLAPQAKKKSWWGK